MGFLAHLTCKTLLSDVISYPPLIFWFDFFVFLLMNVFLIIPFPPFVFGCSYRIMEFFLHNFMKKNKNLYGSMENENFL